MIRRGDVFLTPTGGTQLVVKDDRVRSGLVLAVSLGSGYTFSVPTTYLSGLCTRVKPPQTLAELLAPHLT